MTTTARTGPPGVADQSSSEPPSKTLYVRNLPDKLPKDDLKRNLYMLFATYGVVLDIIALKTMKMRGQAHIVFRDTESSTQAMRALDGFIFFGKELRINYARGTSNTFAKLTGTFELPKQIMPTDQSKPHQSEAATAIFGAAPAKAVPVNEAELAKGTKRGREEEEEVEKEESDDDDAEMQMSESDSE